MCGHQEEIPEKQNKLSRNTPSIGTKQNAKGIIKLFQ